MEFKIEIDSRENNFALISEKIFREIFHSHPAVFRLVLPGTTSGVFVTVRSEKSITDHKTIRLNRDFVKCSMPELEGERIIATRVDSSLQSPKSPIIVSPASVDDWEVIESASNFLEENILSQLTVLFVGQLFPVWVARGQRPVIMQVQSCVGISGSDIPIHLTENSEIAVEAKIRRRYQIGKLDRQKCMHVRVIDTGFPEKTGIHFICNQEDFASHFSPDSGCLVTVRDRPEILGIIASNSRIVDPGNILVSPVMRDKYGLVNGIRIVIEEYTADIGRNIIIPRRVILNAPPGGDKEWIKKWYSYIRNSACVILPQGGWVELAPSEYIKVHFDLPLMMADGVGVSDVGALVTMETMESIDTVIQDLPTDLTTGLTPRPFTKYCPPVISDYPDSGVVVSRVEADRLLPIEKLSIIPSFQKIADRIERYIESCLVHADTSLPFVGSALIVGHKGGCGRTTLIRQIFSRLDPILDYVILDCAMISQPSRFRLDEVKSTISGLIRYGFETPPFGIFFDNVDLLIPQNVDDDDENYSDSSGTTINREEDIRTRKRGKIIGEFLADLIRELRPNRSIFLIATATSDCPLLSRIFTHYERLPNELSMDDRMYLVGEELASDYAGYSLEELVEIRKTGIDNREVRKRLLRGTGAPTSLACASSSPVRLGGLSKQKNELMDAIFMPLNFPFLFSHPGMVSTGAFVVGPSGTGKSALVDLVVRESGLPVEIVRGPDLLDKYIGASEQGVRKVFEKAATIAPCIVVFDAVDALCPRRGSESTGVTDRVVNQMLCYLDGVEKIEGIFVIAISSRPDMVDPALTRSGRLDLTIVCDIPDDASRREIVECLVEDFVGTGVLSDDEIAKLISAVRPACTGADIRSGFVNAKILASRTEGSGVPDFQTIQKCMHAIKPSLSDMEITKNSQYLAKRDSVGTRVMLC